MPKTRHLSDLYVVGKEITLDDGRGPVKVWLQKLSPIDQEKAIRAAGAKRAMVLALSRDGDTDEEARASFTSEMFDVAQDRSAIIDFLAAEQVSEHLGALEAELADEEEWSKDGYIQGLRDTWNEAFLQDAILGELDEEGEKVQSELERFQQEFDKRVVAERDAVAKDLDSLSDAKLIRKATDVIIEARAGSEWLTEYRKCEIWLGVHDPKNKKQRYFKSRAEIDDLSFETLSELVEAYQSLNVEITEGKDSEEVQAS